MDDRPIGVFDSGFGGLTVTRALIDLGFDGFGYGGWPLDEEGALLEDMLALTRSVVPQSAPLHALGIGHPASVAACARMGYTMFDSALPTRAETSL